MNQQLVNQVYQETKSSLKSIYRKRSLTSFFQKIMWLLTGVYFVGVVCFFIGMYSGGKLAFFSKITEKFQPSTANPYATLYYIIPLFVGISLSSYLFAYFFSRFKVLEGNTISKMVKQLFPSFEFSQFSQLSKSKVKESNLFAWLTVNTPVYTFGQMKGRVNGVDLYIADIGVIEENVSNKTIDVLLKIPGINLLVVIYQYVLKNIFTSKSADNVYFSFRGMYCFANFNKNLTTSTVIIPNTLSTKADRFASFKFKNEEKILLEDARFNKHFVVYSPDQIESRYILSSVIMEKIVALKEKFNREIMLSFINNKVFLAVENPNGLFAFPQGNIDSVKVIEELVAEIETAQSLIEELKLKALQ
ncbi:MAG: DUF3137 domain-containing protein [Flavobacteriaceae bacterium]